MTGKLRRKDILRRMRDPLLGALLGVVSPLVSRCEYDTLPRLAARLRFLFSCKRASRRVVAANLATAFPELPEAARAEMASANASQLLLTMLEFLWFMRHPQQVRELVDVSEAKAVLELGRGGAGAMLITPHLGNWELAGQALAAHGVPLCAVASPLMNPRLDAELVAVRRAQGMEIIPGSGAVRGMLKSLRQGKAVGILMDQNVRLSRGGVMVDFFGLPAPTTRAAASLVRKSGAGCLCLACVRVGGRLKIEVIGLPKPVPEYGDDRELVQAQIACNETLIRRHPEQYLWTYKRWRYIPGGLPVETAVRFPFYANPMSDEDEALATAEFNE